MLDAHFDQIRSKLDRLNALSDSINSLERQFDDANCIFRETLKCSTARLSAIARTLGTKSIRHGRLYHSAKTTVEQNQSECQKACVQFERANIDQQIAKKAISEAELRLKEMNKSGNENGDPTPNHVLQSVSLGLDHLKLEDNSKDETSDEYVASSCSSFRPPSTASSSSSSSSISSPPSTSTKTAPGLSPPSDNNNDRTTDLHSSDDLDETRPHNESTKQTSECVRSNHIIYNAAELSEQLNQAIMRLEEAEERRKHSEKRHLDCANRLMESKENLVRLEREYGQSIRRSQLYFDEAKQFNARLNSLKGDISRISREIMAAKKAYAQTLSELERFSEDLHENSAELAEEEVE